MHKVRDLAKECSGPGYDYLGHMQSPEILRAGHNTDELAVSISKGLRKLAKRSGEAAPTGAAAPSGPYKDKYGTDFTRNPDGSPKK